MSDERILKDFLINPSTCIAGYYKSNYGKPIFNLQRFSHSTRCCDLIIYLCRTLLKSV